LSREDFSWIRVSFVAHERSKAREDLNRNVFRQRRVLGRVELARGRGGCQDVREAIEREWGAAAKHAVPGVILVVVPLVSMALLSAQVTVTRLLAYKFFYHFVFFVISLAQLGLAAAGAWIYARRSSAPLGRQLRYSLAALAVIPLTILATYAWLSPPHNLSFSKVDGFDSMLYLTMLATQLVALNFAGGITLTLIFSRYKPSIGTLYGADLAGPRSGVWRPCSRCGRWDRSAASCSVACWHWWPWG
jgi:hypothetical protein